MKVQNISTLLILWCLLLASCNKTVYDQEMRPYTDIVSFYVEEQYAGKQKLQGIISGDSIIVYWNPEVAAPATIVPTIQLADGASISPSSGAAVSFAEQTTYTVTAENGQTKTYTLRVKTNREIPILTGIVASLDMLTPVDQYFWRVSAPTQERSNVYFNLLGEYFLATGNVSDIKVYMQRLHDGYEFDLAVDTATVSNTSLRVELPKFSTQQDSGMHRVWIQVGDLASESKDVYMRSPGLTSANGGLVSGYLAERGTQVSAGQRVTVKYNFSDNSEGAVTRYYDPQNLHTVLLSARRLERIDTTINPRTGREQYTNVFKDESFFIRDFEASTTEVTFNLPAGIEGFVGGFLRNTTFLYQYINAEGVWTHLSSGGALQYEQSILFDNSFFNALDPQTNRYSIQTTVKSATTNSQ